MDQNIEKLLRIGFIRAGIAQYYVDPFDSIEDGFDVRLDDLIGQPARYVFVRSNVFRVDDQVQPNW